jgi:RecJ-like exonuclease
MALIKSKHSLRVADEERKTLPRPNDSKLEIGLQRRYRCTVCYVTGHMNNGGQCNYCGGSGWVNEGGRAAIRAYITKQDKDWLQTQATKKKFIRAMKAIEAMGKVFNTEVESSIADLLEVLSDLTP